VQNLTDSCSLHDMGKVAIPDAILLKPGPLTAEECEAIKRHTFIGGEALRDIDEKLGQASFIAMGREIALFHHERYDGAGYPHGLQGEEIPLSALIVAVADTYDALTSNPAAINPNATMPKRWTSSPGNGAPSSTPTWWTPFCVFRTGWKG
jgi:response regulator RpfG family c-di-GMP phosphodiesterase